MNNPTILHLQRPETRAESFDFDSGKVAGVWNNFSHHEAGFRAGQPVLFYGLDQGS